MRMLGYRSLLVVVMAIALPTNLVGRYSGSASYRRAVVADVKVGKADIDRLLTAWSRCGSPLSDGERRMIADTIARTANRHGYDPLFVQAMVEVESTCRPTARSRAGALGLIQLKPSTARAVARRVGMAWDGPQQLMVPAINLELGLGYLSELEEKFADPYLAVAAYNLGPTRVAGMDPSSARGSRYVRKILNRYEGLLRESGLTRS
jgi:soluble lytic murein transglycosylase-like protein